MSFVIRGDITITPIGNSKGVRIPKVVTLIKDLEEVVEMLTKR